MAAMNRSMSSNAESKLKHSLFKTVHKGIQDEEPITLDEILNDHDLQAENNYVQVSVSSRPREEVWFSPERQKPGAGLSAL